jgi:hypothetical protein
MTCRRICRELLSFVRFGELGPSSRPHLEHLAGCQPCRDEIGYDREMVRRLRQALAARIEGMDPSPAVWDQILVRAQAPDPGTGWIARLAGVAGRRRSTTAMAGTALALVLALNMQVVPLGAPQRSDATGTITASGPQAVKRAPTSRATGASTAAEAEAPASEAEPVRAVPMTGLVAAFEPPAAAPVGDAVPQPEDSVHPPEAAAPVWLEDHAIAAPDAPEPEPMAPQPAPDLGQPS